jgi:hypothetical protein
MFQTKILRRRTGKMEKLIIRYARKSKTAFVPTGKAPNGEMLYKRTVLRDPCGVLLATAIDGKIFIGWSYISDMNREEGRPSFIKKAAVKIALDKVRATRNGKPVMWYLEDMPYAIREVLGKEEPYDFLLRAAKYFKVNDLGNFTYEDKPITWPERASLEMETSIRD